MRKLCSVCTGSCVENKPVQERLHQCTKWKEVGAIFHGFLSSADATFEPSVDTYSGWVSVLGRSPAESRRTFVAAWATKV
eukprot:SAG31_NODE_28586_length_408_cov_0.504854_1_plen_79_part_10